MIFLVLSFFMLFGYPILAQGDESNSHRELEAYQQLTPGAQRFLDDYAQWPQENKDAIKVYPHRPDGFVITEKAQFKPPYDQHREGLVGYLCNSCQQEGGKPENFSTNLHTVIAYIKAKDKK